ncbi:TonB-linked SusC/RagA family outer membrane protein [Chitinophaga niastensis]|uniref:TonB-linked SusC/RagA family outer membrane protein n=1 Tax=Chitinophaga niastensis TaxID=536980 RepID=A0A2P8HP69_CHINA|nr:TonB-dependent receptor [Chitinophaga niastensis]PSL48014.1 TonB-linked SusC/RagA family outer membrane protein [Chitinophaga niastensis]
MKLTALLLLVCFLQVSATLKGQATITLKLKKVEIAHVLSSIEQQGNYRFLYNNALTEIRKKVNVNVTNSSIEELMNTILTGTTLRYKLTENNLVVIMSDAPQIQDIKITGKVTSNKGGQPLPGVTISIKGSSHGTVTNNDGNYTLTAPENSTLVVTFIGFASQEVPVNNRAVIDITMSETVNQVEEVVVVGYCMQRKVDITGAIAQVKGEEISKQPVPNAVSGLQGKVAGVQIINSGKPGASPGIKIRGTGTIYGSPNPLYVVDGVWYDDISFLNPADIENMSILKDASSEAIYGIRAANGVVLITTKKGKAGKPVVNYNGFVGIQRVTNKVKMANAHEYAILVNELNKQNGQTTDVLNPNDFGQGTNWYNEALRNALVTNHQVSVSGGSEKSTYNFSVGYLKQEGIVKTNDFSRFTARLQNDFQVFEPLRIGYTVTASVYSSNDIPEFIFTQLYNSAPVVPVHNADGSYGDPGKYNLGDGPANNPQATLDFYNQTTKRHVVTGSVYADLRFAKHFTFHTSAGGEYGDSIIRNYTPVYAATIKQRNDISVLMRTNTDRQSWIVENTLTYDNKFGDHSLRVLAGQSAQQYKFYKLIASAQNVPNNSEGDHYLRLGNTDGREVKDEGDLYTVSSYFSRVNYAYKNKYLLTASMRADGSSKFYGNQRWGYFPSVGVGWVISEEPFLKNTRIFDNLKLRGSWGKIGNASVPSNLSVLRVAQDPYLTAILGGNVNTGASINSIVAPVTYWERAAGTDIGLEASVLNNRLYVEAGYYNKRTELAIFDVPFPGSVGTKSSTIITNQANFQNRGMEFSVNWKDGIGKKSFSYAIGANLGINNNKVLSVETGGNPIYGGGNAATGGALGTRTIVGQPIGQFFGYQVDGIFQTDAEAAASAQPNAKAGDFKYRDVSGSHGKPDGKIDFNDRVPLGNPNPKYTYGINTYFTYKDFDLTLDFQGVAGVDVYNANLGLRYGNENFTKDFYDKRWHGEGTSNSYPSAIIGGRQNYLPNSFFVESGSYFRIRTMQLGYSLPAMVTDRWKMKKLRVYLNAQNAFNFFKYRGFSPEIGGTPNNVGIDNNVYPLYATYNFGVNVTF